MKKKPFFYSLVLYATLILSILVLGYLGLVAFSMSADMAVNMDETTFYTADNLLTNLLLLGILLLAFALLLKLTQKVPSLVLFGITAGLVTVFLVWLIGQVQATPTWDAYRTFTAAEGFVQKDYQAFLTGGYISHYPFQVPICVYDSLLIRLFGDNYIAPQLVNVLYWVGIHYFLYKSTYYLSQEDEIAAKAALLLNTFFFPFMLYTLFIYSNVVSQFFLVLGLFLTIKYLKGHRLLWMGLAILSVGIASSLKGTAYIGWIAIVLVFILDSLEHFSWKPLLVGLATCLLTFFIPNLYTYTIESQNENINLKSSLFVEYALDMGAKRGLRGPGWHDGWLESYLEENYTNDNERKEKAWQVIQEDYQKLLTNPSTFFSFYYDKINSMWTNSEFQGFWTIQANKNETYGLGDPKKQSFLWITYYPEADNYGTLVQSFMTGDLNQGIRFFLNSFQNLIYLSSFLFVILGTKKKIFSHRNLLFLLTFLGGFLFLLIWEAKAQYSVLFFMLLFPLSAQSLALGYETLQAKLTQKRA